LGEPLWQIRQEVRLPADLAALPYLQEVYGTVAWAVNGVYRQYTGWYDFDPAHLNSGDPAALDRALAEAAGGAQAIVERARKAQADGQYQLALELVETAIGADNDAAAHRLRAELLERLAAGSKNSMDENIYREAAAQEHSGIAAAISRKGVR